MEGWWREGKRGVKVQTGWPGRFKKRPKRQNDRKQGRDRPGGSQWAFRPPKMAKTLSNQPRGILAATFRREMARFWTQKRRMTHPRLCGRCDHVVASRSRVFFFHIFMTLTAAPTPLRCNEPHLRISLRKTYSHEPNDTTSKKQI